MIKIAFTDETKDSIIAKQKEKGLILLEEQRHYDGMWLLFDKTRPIEPLSEVEVLKQKVADLEIKVATFQSVAPK